MFNLQGSEIIFILLIALVVLGPEKLPGAVKKATKTYSEFRKMSSSFQTEFKSVIDEPMREMRETADLLKESADPMKVAEAAEREAEASAQAERERAARPPQLRSDAPAGFDATSASDADADDAAAVDDEWADPIDEPADADPLEAGALDDEDADDPPVDGDAELESESSPVADAADDDLDSDDFSEATA